MNQKLQWSEAAKLPCKNRCNTYLTQSVEAAETKLFKSCDIGIFPVLVLKFDNEMI